MSLNRYHMVGMAHDISHGYDVGCVLEPYHSAQGVLSQVAEVLGEYGQEFTLIPSSWQIVHNGQDGRLILDTDMEFFRGMSFDVLVIPEHTDPGLSLVIADTVIEY